MPDDSSARRGAQAASMLGIVIGAVALFFVIRTLVRDRDEISDALDGAMPGWIGLAVVLAALAMLAIALPWRRALRLLGGDLPTGQVLARYFVGEIGKFVPGGVWPVLGRGELASRHGVPRRVAYSSVALSLATLYLGAMFVVALGLPALLGGDDGTGPIAVLVLLPLGHRAPAPGGPSPHPCLHRAHHTALVRRDHPVVGRHHRPGPAYVPAWLAIGTATWAVARSMEPARRPRRTSAWRRCCRGWSGSCSCRCQAGSACGKPRSSPPPGRSTPGSPPRPRLVARAVFVVVDLVGAMIGALAIRTSRSDGSGPGRGRPFSGSGPPPSSTGTATPPT